MICWDGNRLGWSEWKGKVDGQRKSIYCGECPSCPLHSRECPSCQSKWIGNLFISCSKPQPSLVEIFETYEKGKSKNALGVNNHSDGKRKVVEMSDFANSQFLIHFFVWFRCIVLFFNEFFFYLFVFCSTQSGRLYKWKLELIPRLISENDV